MSEANPWLLSWRPCRGFCFNFGIQVYVSGQTPVATQPQQREKLLPKEDPLETRIYKLEIKVRELERRVDRMENKMRP